MTAVPLWDVAGVDFSEQLTRRPRAGLNPQLLRDRGDNARAVSLHAAEFSRHSPDGGSSSANFQQPFYSNNYYCCYYYYLVAYADDIVAIIMAQTAE